MFGVKGELTVAVPGEGRFYSLFADGPLVHKYVDKDSGVSFLAYGPGAVIALFYTYPSLRAAALVRNCPGPAAFPGLSSSVRPLIQTRASGVDKLRRALGRLRSRHGGPFSFPDDFYLRLGFLIARRGKLSFLDIDSLADRFVSSRPGSAGEPKGVCRVYPY